MFKLSCFIVVVWCSIEAHFFSLVCLNYLSLSGYGLLANWSLFVLSFLYNLMNKRSTFLFSCFFCVAVMTSKGLFIVVWWPIEARSNYLSLWGTSVLSYSFKLSCFIGLQFDNQLITVCSKYFLWINGQVRYIFSLLVFCVAAMTSKLLFVLVW